MSNASIKIYIKSLWSENSFPPTLNTRFLKVVTFAEGEFVHCMK